MKIIVVGVDFSNETERLLVVASDLAKALGARVVVLHVAPPEPAFVSYEPGPPAERAFQARKLRQEHRDVQSIAASLTAAGLSAEGLLVSGATAPKLLEEAERLNADMLVMGSHGHGALYHLIVGSVAEEVLRKAKHPVLIVPCRDAKASA